MIFFLWSRVHGEAPRHERGYSVEAFAGLHGAGLAQLGCGHFSYREDEDGACEAIA